MEPAASRGPGAGAEAGQGYESGVERRRGLLIFLYVPEAVSSSPRILFVPALSSFRHLSQHAHPKSLSGLFARPSLYPVFPLLSKHRHSLDAGTLCFGAHQPRCAVDEL
eukprot:6030828-Prymnesium_polylepis.1